MGKDLSWQIDGMEFHGKSWGNPDGTPVLMLHGWMDHADSFAQLAPLLTSCQCVALDLSGHGWTDHRAAHASYNIWDDLPQIDKIISALGWDRCTLIGHSRGAIIGTLFAAAMPEKVSKLIGLDAIMVEETDLTIATTLHNFITQNQKQKEKSPRIFETRQDYIDRRIQNGNSKEVAEQLSDRALAPVDAGYQLRADMRLFASSAVKLKTSDIVDVFHALACPVLTIWAQDGILNGRPKMQKTADLARVHIKNYHSVTLPGDHHFMMSPKQTPAIATKITQFLQG